MSLSHEGDVVRDALQHMLARIEAAEVELGRLDAAAGDGDHGAGMVRGLRAANAALPASEDRDQSPGALLERAGSAFADAAGGASGALVGTLLQSVGQSLGSAPCTTAAVHTALDAGLAMICQLGKARPGDKTMIDTLGPFVRALAAGATDGLELPAAWSAALTAAEAGAHSTAEMISRRGRSSRLGERSRGHLDPGAVSMLYMLQAVGEVLGE